MALRPMPMVLASVPARISVMQHESQFHRRRREQHEARFKGRRTAVRVRESLFSRLRYWGPVEILLVASMLLFLWFLVLWLPSALR